MGAGVPLQFVNYLIDEHKRFKNLLGHLKPNHLNQILQMDTDPSQLNQRSIQQAMSGLKNAMDPKMLRQIGGMEGLSRMMKAAAMRGGKK